MTLYCDFCGRRWFAHWPEFWPYRYKDEIYCSENCRICSATLIKLGKGEKKLMARMKKDGTPAKKPGRKPTIKLDGELKIETPEAHNVDIVETPEAVKGPVSVDEFCKIAGYPDEEPKEPKKTAPLNYDGYTVRCIEGQYGKFYWDYEYNRLDWTSPEGEEVSLSPQGWRTFCTEVMPKVMAILGVPGDE